MEWMKCNDCGVCSDQFEAISEGEIDEAHSAGVFDSAEDYQEALDTVGMHQCSECGSLEVEGI